jgi:hypothetical protein
MFYRFRLFVVLGLFLLAGCLPASLSRSKTQSAPTQNPATQMPIDQAQAAVQVIVSDTPTASTLTPPLPAPVTFTYTVTPAVTATVPSSTPVFDPFANFPEEYRSIQLPQQILDIIKAGGFVVPLPSNAGVLQRELLGLQYRPDLSRFDLNRIVNFSFETGNQYIAVPITAEYYKSHFGSTQDFTKGALVGLIYDKSGTYNIYTHAAAVYEIWAYENYVSLTDIVTGKAIILEAGRGEYYWRTQDVSSDLPLAVFVKGSCHLCWRIDQRCGCLICRQ